MPNFAQIPGLIEHLLIDGPEPGLPQVTAAVDPRPETVVLFLIDGFGFNLVRRHADRVPLLRHAMRSGTAWPIRSQFPSTTAAHVTTIHTGLPVGVSGVCEWQYYEPILDRVYAPLTTEMINAHLIEQADRMHIERALPPQTLYEKLASRGVTSVCFQRDAYADSPFSQRVCRGATMVGYRDVSDALRKVADCLATPAAGRRYLLVYIDIIDSLSHAHGPFSDPVDAALAALFEQIEAVVLPALPARSCVLMTADHGLTPTRRDVLYVDEVIPDPARWVKTTRDGLPIAPTGGKRDLFLHVEAPFVDAAFEACTAALAGRASVRRTDAMIAEGVFGPVVTPRLRDRVGDLMILPGEGQRVWWSGGGRFRIREKLGDHGGLSADEMEIPLISLG